MADAERTEQEDMGKDERRARQHARWPRLKALVDKVPEKPSSSGAIVSFVSLWTPAIFIIVSIALVIYSISNIVLATLLASYWLTICGAIQVCAGTYLSARKVFWLKQLVEQEKGKPTTFMRDIDLVRFFLSVLQKLEKYKSLFPKDENWKSDVVSYLNGLYTTEESEKRTVSRKMKLLSQEDLATVFLGSSFSATYGTVFLLLGVVTSALHDLLTKGH